MWFSQLKILLRHSSLVDIFKEKFAKIQSPEATGHLYLSAHILVLCIIERMYPQGLNAL